jgi:hypothetical protein
MFTRYFNILTFSEKLANKLAIVSRSVPGAYREGTSNDKKNNIYI